MRQLYVACLLLFVFATAGFSQTKISNPILAGFYPDPSICKVGENYYLINSTFTYFPGIPVFQSRDLKNWKQISSVIDRPSQMTFMGEQVSRGLFAPSISYHDGLFYVICTNIDHGGNFVVTAKNPSGPWSDPIWLREINGIDPSIFFDGDKAYIVYNSNPPGNKPLYSGHRTIRVNAFDPKTFKVISGDSILVNGGVDLSKKPVWIEGPHLYKRNGWYYLMAAEGGTSVNHSEVILRSKSPWGPFVPYEHNPILTQRNLDPNRKNPITSTGHADLVEGPDGQTYAVFLGVRPYQGDDYNTGRETFFAPVKWENDWPIINPGHEEVLYQYTVPWKEVKQTNAMPLNGNFSYSYNFKKGLSPDLLFLRTMDHTWFNFMDGNLTMNLKPEMIMQKGNPAFIGRRQQHLNCNATTALSFAAKSESEKAGLIIFQNEHHFYYLCKSINNGKPVVQLYRGTSSDDTMELIKQEEIKASSSPMVLKIEANQSNYSFWFGEDSKHLNLLADHVDGTYLSTHVAGGFVGALFGLYATSSGQPSTNKVIFSSFSYSGNDLTFKP